jgi:hypothetical protein
MTRLTLVTVAAQPLCGFSLGIAQVIIQGLLVFPRDWDTWGDHLPMVAQWIQARCLFTLDCSHWSNPGTNELLGPWAVAPFSGDYFIGLVLRDRRGREARS